jgi:hypothetical protein
MSNQALPLTMLIALDEMRRQTMCVAFLELSTRLAKSEIDRGLGLVCHPPKERPLTRLPIVRPHLKAVTSVVAELCWTRSITGGYCPFREVSMRKAAAFLSWGTMLVDAESQLIEIDSAAKI